eukprot:632684-Pelagomonas_calceolata.AAC.10
MLLDCNEDVHGYMGVEKATKRARVCSRIDNWTFKVAVNAVFNATKAAKGGRESVLGFAAVAHAQAHRAAQSAHQTP